jgi:hypothetical protein
MTDKDRRDFLLSLFKERKERDGGGWLYPTLDLINSTYKLDPPVTQEEWDEIIIIKMRELDVSY